MGPYAGPRPAVAGLSRARRVPDWRSCTPETPREGAEVNPDVLAAGHSDPENRSTFFEAPRGALPSRLVALQLSGLALQFFP